MAEGEAAPPRELTELESLQLKCNEKTDESLESTRRMKSMCEEAKDMGIKTLVLLDDQGEQIEKFENAAIGINNDMRLAEDALKAMDLLCGIFPKFWKKSGGFKEDDAVWGAENVLKVRISSERFLYKFVEDFIWQLKLNLLSVGVLNKYPLLSLSNSSQNN